MMNFTTVRSVNYHDNLNCKYHAHRLGERQRLRNNGGELCALRKLALRLALFRPMLNKRAVLNWDLVRSHAAMYLWWRALSAPSLYLTGVHTHPLP